MSEKIKPCLCGNTNITITMQGSDCSIRCDKCGYSTSVQPEFLLASAEWNIRNKDAKAKVFRCGRRPKKAREEI